MQIILMLAMKNRAQALGALHWKFVRILVGGGEEAW